MLKLSNTIQITEIKCNKGKTKFMSDLEIGDILKIDFEVKSTGYNDYSAMCTIKKNNKEEHKDYLKKIAQWLNKHCIWVEVNNKGERV